MTNPIDAAAAKRETAEVDAAEQSAEYGGIAGTVYTTRTGKTFPVPDLSLLDDEQQERFELLQFTFQQCDKAPEIEIPSRTIETADGQKVTHPARKVDGGYLIPYRKGGELLVPSYNVQLATALLGEDGYQEFKAAKGKASEFARAVTKLNEAIGERAEDDSKSVDSTGDLAPVSD